MKESIPNRPARKPARTPAGKPPDTSKRPPNPANPGGKPRKPYPDFPLTSQSGGYWMKKINGKLYYFGRWGRMVDGKMVRLPGDGWREALELYKVQRDDLYAGRTPPPAAATGTVGQLCNAFRTAMERRLEAGRKMSPRMYAEYASTCDRLVQKFGVRRPVADLKPRHFTDLGSDLAAQFGPVRLGNEIQRVRTVFKWGFDNEEIATAPRYGSEFRKPSKDELRKHRNAQGARTFTADEVRRFLGYPPCAPAGDAMTTAIVLLGINAAFGNTDCAALPLSAVDLDGGWVTFPRPKTGLTRRAKLWPVTVAAIRAWLAERPEPADTTAATLVFLTPAGRPWPANSIAHKFGKVARRLGINGHRGYYTLRHTFRTVADGSKDLSAIRTVMGHIDGSIDGNYTHGIDDGRLEAVAAFVRAWLFGAEGGAV